MSKDTSGKPQGNQNTSSSDDDELVPEIKRRSWPVRVWGPEGPDSLTFNSHSGLPFDIPIGPYGGSISGDEVEMKHVEENLDRLIQAATEVFCRLRKEESLEPRVTAMGKSVGYFPEYWKLDSASPKELIDAARIMSLVCQTTIGDRFQGEAFRNGLNLGYLFSRLETLSPSRKDTFSKGMKAKRADKQRSETIRKKKSKKQRALEHIPQLKGTRKDKIKALINEFGIPEGTAIRYLALHKAMMTKSPRPNLE